MNTLRKFTIITQKKITDSKLYVELERVRWKNGKGELHREDGPAVVFVTGTTYWYLNNKCHREDGPAIDHSNGTTYWYLNGQRHRENGPACEKANGYKRYYLKDVEFSEEEYNAKIKTLR